MTLTDRFRLAARALVGTFTADVGGTALNMLRGVTPGGVGSPPVRGTRELLQSYGAAPWLRAIVGRIADAEAAVEWQLFVVGKPAKTEPAKRIARMMPTQRRAALRDAARDGELRPVTEHLLLDLLASGNPYHTGFDLRRLTTISREIVGEAYWLKERNGLGAPIAAWPIPPDWILNTPTVDRRTYRVSFRGWQGEIPDTEVLPFVIPSPANPYGRGTGIGQTLGDELQTDEHAAKTVLQWFYGRATPDVLITAEGLQDGEVKRLEQKWHQKNQGFWRMFKTHFVNRKVDIHEFQQNFRNQQLIPIREHERDLILQTWGLPPELLGLRESSNRSTIEVADYHMSRYLIEPRCEAMRCILQERLIPEYDARLILDYVSPTQDDKDYRLKVKSAAPWAFRADEWRAEAGMDELDGGMGQVFVVPTNVQSVTDLAAIPAPAAPSFGPPPMAPAPVPPKRYRKELLEDESALLQAAAGLEAGLETALLTGVVRAQAAVDEATIAGAVTNGQAHVAEAAAGLGTLATAWQTTVPVALENGHTNGAATAAETLQTAGVTVRLDLIPAQAVRWAQTHAATLVTALVEETREAVRAIITDAISGQLTPDAAAKRIRQIVGMTPRQATAVDRFAETLEANGVTGDTLVRRVGRYAEAQIRQRAETIARTEILTALNTGQRALWSEGVAQGAIDPGTMTRQWIATPDDRLEPNCERLDGTQAPLGGTYPGGVSGPPLHPNCRCSEGLVVRASTESLA